MSDETAGAPAPETPEPQPATPAAPAPTPTAVTAPARGRWGVEIPRWAAVALGAVVVFAGGFGIARATSDTHGSSERDSRSASVHGDGNRGGNTRTGNGNRESNRDGMARSGSSRGSQPGGVAPHTRTRGS